MSKYISIVTEECVNIPTIFFFKTTTTDDYVAVYGHAWCAPVYYTGLELDTPKVTRV